ncbi:MAG: SDR family NAD(P)-dependent oxidoreductase [Gemmatales bacterium]|nr:SDR family NAD(P)-dependent oxidoreductase [Gemmatales bacterium]MCS7160333.1 SDR family NAD(P)-dependent oxidoreductase [Gemmatales bacterium]MDW8175533.1 SDR family NAD(P)-dependent oxidoreductase [Gemmatales bacterium]MDW8221558.1 SDR family NAD(P)-dependent oxidoreductase [Gemmatales bacterium]
MALPFENQVALITGAARGLGRQLALEMAAHGAVIAAVDRDVSPMESLMQELKSRGRAGGFEQADVTQRDRMQQAVAVLEQRLGPVEILVANAGIGYATPAAAFDAEAFAALVEVNLNGVANSIAAVLPGMLQRQRGHLVAISSLAALRGLGYLAGYSASKAGVNALMDSLRLELAPRGIYCTTICPGWIRTDLTRHLPLPKPDLMSVEEAARRIVTAIIRRKPFYAFPWSTAWVLRLCRILPTGWSDGLLRAYGRRLLRRVQRLTRQ